MTRKAMPNDFGSVLEEAALLLRDLPRGYRDVPEAQRRTADWRETHSGLDVDLLVDQPPGSLRVDYDLLLSHPDGGTLALTWQGAQGLPWLACYADHWAANFVVTVNGESITVQQALTALRMSANAHSDLMTDLVNQKILLQAVDQEKPPVTDEELEEAANRFRRANRLDTAADTFRWLEEMRLTQAQFEAMLEATVQSRKVKGRITAERLESYFEAHRDEYDQICLFEVRVPDPDMGEQLVAAAREAGLLTATEAMLRYPSMPLLEGTLAVRHAGTLPPPLRTASPGEIIGPYLAEEHYRVAQVYSRQAASLKGETRDAVQEAISQEWLAQQRTAATVHWHWM
jgi:putative peptide maturation system protein